MVCNIAKTRALALLLLTIASFTCFLTTVHSVDLDSDVNVSDFDMESASVVEVPFYADETPLSLVEDSEAEMDSDDAAPAAKKKKDVAKKKKDVAKKKKDVAKSKVTTQLLVNAAKADKEILKRVSSIHAIKDKLGKDIRVEGGPDPNASAHKNNQRPWLPNMWAPEKKLFPREITAIPESILSGQYKTTMDGDGLPLIYSNITKPKRTAKKAYANEALRYLVFDVDQSLPLNVAQAAHIGRYYAPKNKCAVPFPKLNITTNLDTDAFLAYVNKVMYKHYDAPVGTVFNITYGSNERVERVKLVASVYVKPEYPSTYLLYWPSANALISVWRGPVVVENWIHHRNAPMEDWTEGPFCSFPKYRNLCGRVHADMYQTYKYLNYYHFLAFEKALKIFESYVVMNLEGMAKKKHHISGMYFTGHGIGGALAAMAGIDTTMQYGKTHPYHQAGTISDKEIYVVTFSAPRFSTGKFARFVHRTLCTNPKPNLPFYFEQAYLTFRRYTLGSFDQYDYLTVSLPFPYGHVGRESTMLCTQCKGFTKKVSYDLHSPQEYLKGFSAMRQSLDRKAWTPTEVNTEGAQTLRFAVVTPNVPAAPKGIPKLLWNRMLPMFAVPSPAVIAQESKDEEDARRALVGGVVDDSVHKGDNAKLKEQVSETIAKEPFEVNPVTNWVPVFGKDKDIAVTKEEVRVNAQNAKHLLKEKERMLKVLKRSSKRKDLKKNAKATKDEVKAVEAAKQAKRSLKREAKTMKKLRKRDAKENRKVGKEADAPK